MSYDLLRQNWVHFIASDAHSIEGRPPALGEAYQILGAEFGKETAERLCVLNPRAAFGGDPLGRQPEPLNLYEETQPARRGFMRGIFGR
jgi:protein-tyrosine phosphatase